MASSLGTPVTLTVAGARLPGRSRPPGPGFAGYDEIHVGVQRRGKPADLFGLTPGDMATARWTLECEARAAPDGMPDIVGPYVQGPVGDRYVYLSWGSIGSDGAFMMFRRAKLLLAAVPPEVLADAVAACRLTARLDLTDAEGNPLCARVVPPAVTWSAE